ncbi:MAG: hypothetical protein DMG67_14870, partial [Acidobacteria bacterium]
MRPKMTFIPLLMLVWATMLSAFPHEGAIVGTVRSTGGVPQMGATVEVLAGVETAMTVFTDDHGRYTALGLVPGHYQIKVTAASFLPALRENIILHSGSKLIVN